MHLNLFLTFLAALLFPLQTFATTPLLPRQTPTSTPCNALGTSTPGACNPDSALLSWASGIAAVPVTTIIFTLPTTTATLVLPVSMVSSLESEFASDPSSTNPTTNSVRSTVYSRSTTSPSLCVNSQDTTGVHSLSTSVGSSATATPTPKGDATQGASIGSMVVLWAAVAAAMSLL
ncbi:hypothetical protein B7494_g2053 [Chlorociboria aeruginascens]|nr:hypothetical protein B7494_g2053 [Chlorociboria aeruginascens]